MQKDVDSLWKSLHQYEGVFHGYIRNLSDYNTIIVPLCPDVDLPRNGKRDSPSLFIATNLIHPGLQPSIQIWKPILGSEVTQKVVQIGVGLTEREV